MTRLPVGDIIRQFPAGTFNRLVDMLDDYEQQGGFNPAINNEDNIQGSDFGGALITIVNKTGGDLNEYDVAGLGEPAFDLPTGAADVADESLLNGVHFEVAEINEDDHEGKFVIAIEPIEDDGVGRGLMPGASWARVDIRNEEDETCGIESAEKSCFISGKGSTPIIWNPSEVGVRWCLIRLGGASASAKAKIVGALAIIKGTVPASSGIDTSGALVDRTGSEPVGKDVVDFGVLAANYTKKPSDTFTEGALLVNPDEKAILRDDPDFVPPDPQTEPPTLPDKVLYVVDVFNPSYTDFVAPDDGIAVAGTLVEFEEEGAEPIEAFLLPAFDLHSLPGYDESEEQAPYHDVNAKDFKLGRGECEEPA